MEWFDSPISGWYRLAREFRIPWQSQCLWATECHSSTHFACTCTEWTFDHLLLHFTCMDNSGGGLLVLGRYGCFRWFFQCLDFSGQFSTSFGWWFLSGGCLLLGGWLSLFIGGKNTIIVKIAHKKDIHKSMRETDTYGFRGGGLLGDWFLRGNSLLGSWFS